MRVSSFWGILEGLHLSLQFDGCCNRCDVLDTNGQFHREMQIAEKSAKLAKRARFRKPLRHKLRGGRSKVHYNNRLLLEDIVRLKLKNVRGVKREIKF